MLNFETLKIILIGDGIKLHERTAKLHELGAKNLTILQSPISSLIEFKEFDIALIVGLPDDECKKLHSLAKTAKCLVNVEDKKEYCDFFFQSFVKRGKLLISVSTNGTSPGTAKLVRNKIEQTFPKEWAEHIDEIALKRTEWKTSGKTYDEVNELTKAYVKNKKWL